MAATRGEQQSIISVRRGENGYQDRFRAYRLIIDGQRAGKLKRGQSIQIGVEPGTHSVQMSIDWCSSKTLDVDVAVGARINLLCRPASDPTVTTNSMLTASRDGYIILEFDSPA
jgi:hypothetical protein